MRAARFPEQLGRVEAVLRAQEPRLREVAAVYAAALAAGGLVHVYANGHSRIAVEEMVVRMGALTGFHALVADGLASFLDVVGPSGIRVNQAIERVEGLGAALLDELEVGAGEPLVVVSATGQTAAAVDMAREWVRRYPANPLVAICSAEQARTGAPKHSSGETLHHVVTRASRAWLLDNGMPMGDLTLRLGEGEREVAVCPLSSIGALAVVQTLNEMTVERLLELGVEPMTLSNMHLRATGPNYDAWLRDQRHRYARARRHPEPVEASR